MKLEEIIRTGLTRLDVVHVRTAINPLLWLVGLTTTLSFGALVLVPDQIVRIALIGFASFPVIVTIGAYIWLMLKDPDRLQSEEYRIKQRALQILRRRGSTTEVVDVAVDTPRIRVQDRTSTSRRPE